MKKSLLTLTMLAVLGCFAQAQTVIYDNGPQVILPGGGFGGADVSHLHDGMNSLGSNQSFANGFRVAEDIVIPAGESWQIDSVIVYGYQTQATNNTVSTFLDINVRIWDGVPGAVGSNIVFGDDVNNRMITSEWSGIYRTADFGATCEPTTCTQRAIMRNALDIGSTTLAAGTYWIDWQSNGSLTSGPWAPQLNLGVGITTSGNALQFVAANLAWQAMVDTVPANAANEPQGLPFLVVGTILTGIESINTNNNITISPNPVVDVATVTINIPMDKNAEYSFHMYDMLGNTTNDMRNITSTKFEFRRDNLPNGIYFYEMKKNNNVLKMGKIILQ